MQSTITGSAALLTTRQAASLKAFASFRTVDGPELEPLVRQGLLISETALRQRCLDAIRPAPAPPPISTVAVITRDRIDTLRRCLESYIAAARRAGRTLDYLVIDTSEKAQMRDATRSMLHTIRRESSVTVGYAGLEEQHRFADALQKAGLPAPAIDFTLFDPLRCNATYGAARNAVLLATLGRLVLCADDDTLSTVAPMPESTPDGLALSSRNDPTAIRFFTDHAAALASAHPIERDIFDIHADLLGRDVASSLGPAKDALRLDDLDGMLLRAIESGRAQVAVTAAGMHGDAGGGMPPAIRLMDPASRARLVDTNRNYEALARSRDVQRGVPVRTISNGPYLMTIGAGFDNRATLPPFFPVLRGEDTIFGFMLGLAVEGACIGHLPYTVEHSPAEARQVAPDAIAHFAEHPASFELVIACLQSYSPPPGASARDRLLGLGRHLREIATLAPADFEEFLRLWIWRMKALVLARLTHDLDAFSTASPAWIRDVRQYLDRARESMAKDGYLVAPELEARFGPEALRVTQSLVGRFGEVVECWPAMLEVTRSLAASGGDLAPPLQGS